MLAAGYLGRPYLGASVCALRSPLPSVLLLTLLLLLVMRLGTPKPYRPCHAHILPVLRSLHICMVLHNYTVLVGDERVPRWGSALLPQRL